MDIPHVPTDEFRKISLDNASIGLKHEDIAALIGIDDKTLRKYYRKELNLGRATAISKVGGVLFKKCMQGDTASVFFYLKTKGGFRETDNPKKESQQVIRKVGGLSTEEDIVNQNNG